MRMKNNGICDYKGFEKVNPYEYKRKLNSKDMTDYNTARRTEVETNEERQNRLQLAIYRENERLQHLQDQNNRDSYLSNGFSCEFGVIAKHYPLLNVFLNSYYLSEIIRRI